MTTSEIIRHLRKNEMDFFKIEKFSDYPGIYSFFFIGESFPVFGNAVKKHDIIYIGKTESSQDKRDAKTHFASGKTGSSTVRRSIGALLCDIYSLTPIPRNNVDIAKGRLSHYKFDDKSEEILTNWMKENLAISFFEYPKNKRDIEKLETLIIQELTPILNISKNPNNPFKNKLQQLRKNCSQIAANYKTTSSIENIRINKSQSINSKIMATAGKYIDLWTKQRENIKAKLKDSAQQHFIQLNPSDFSSVGNRRSYSFNLEYLNGQVANNISGSAVARDLAQTLESSREIKEILKSGHFKFNLDKTFCLWIQKKYVG